MVAPAFYGPNLCRLVTSLLRSECRVRAWQPVRLNNLEARRVPSHAALHVRSPGYAAASAHTGGVIVAESVSSLVICLSGFRSLAVG